MNTNYHPHKKSIQPRTWKVRARWTRAGNQLLSGLVVLNLFISLIAPAIQYPLPVQPLPTDLSQRIGYASEELMFKLLLADQANAQGNPADLVGGEENLSALQAGFDPGGVTPQAAFAAGQAAQSVGQIPVSDFGTHIGVGTVNSTLLGNHLSDTISHKVELGLKDTVFVALKQSLDNFLNSMAYDVATWLASGGKGQQPMFYTQGWGPYLQDLASNAAGTFISNVSKSWLGFNVCDPSNIQLKISFGLGLANIQRPQKPVCTLNQMVNNWSSMIHDPNFLNRFHVIFNPQQNDIGVMFSVFDKYFDSQTQSTQTGILDRLGDLGAGFKAVVSKISNVIKTPASLVSAEGQHLRTDAVSAEWQKVQYGDIVMDAVSTFVNTLAGKLFQRLFQEGLVGDSTQPSKNQSNTLLSSLLSGLHPSTQTGQDLTSADTTVAGSNNKTAQLRFVDLLLTGTTNQPYDILTQLSTCLDPKNPGPEDCAITPTMRSAIQQHLSVQQAIDQGFIDGDAPFGTMTFDPTTMFQGISYRSIVLMRVHRIVPIGWELAAQAIDKFDHNKKISLNNLISNFNDPTSHYFGLIDPDWVLEVPEHLCKAEGYGPKILFSQAVNGLDANKNGSYNDIGDVQPQLLVGRAQYCADTQTCLTKNDDGSCQYYGYCAEERRVWDFGGSSCLAPDHTGAYNTCQTFQNSSGTLVSYLRDSLNFNGCSADNVGCQWYCTQFNTVNNVWTCQNNSEQVIKPCNQPGGCPLSVSCTVPQGQTSCADSRLGVNLAVSQTCDSSSKWWNATAGPNGTGACIISTNCTIPQGGVQCTTTGCEALPNLLSNPSFELGVSTPGGLALNWDTSSGDTSYFQRVSGASERIADGRYDIRFYNAGSIITPQDFHSTPLKLIAGKTYTYSGWFYNHLNTGTITITALGAVDPADPTKLNPSKTVDSKNQWQQVSFDFIAPSSSTPVTIAVSVGGSCGDPAGCQISGTAWFDGFVVSENCITTPVTLSLVGLIGLDQSKLHLDANAATCQASDAGCSQFVQMMPNNGTNVVPNGSFENWPNPTDFPPGWVAGVNWENNTTEKVEQSTAAVGGNFSLKITNGPTALAYRDLSTQTLIGVKPNTSYRVTFWAKTDGSNDNNWYSELLSDPTQGTPTAYCSQHPSRSCAQNTDCPGGNPADTTNYSNETCAFDYQPLRINGDQQLQLTPDWQRYVFDVMTTRQYGQNFRLSFNNGSTDTGHPLYIDEVQIEEVATNNPVVSDYNEYGSNNVAYIKKPPASLACKGYSPDRPSPYVLPGFDQTTCTGDTHLWLPQTQIAGVAQVDCTGAQRIWDPTTSTCYTPAGCHEIDASACANYSPYCFADEVGCDAYSPLNGSASIPGIISNSDFCPAECVGYEAYKQSKTVFESQETLEYFIPKTAQQCTVAGAGCDEFTNLDEASSGGEARHDYTYLRLCQKPTDTAGNPVASCQNFYTWQGSDESGYQLKVYSLVNSTGTGPDQAMPYDAANPDNTQWPAAWCNDKTNDGNGMPKCCDSAESVATNPFCKQFYDVNGQVHYAIYNNTITCSNDCHPYRKTRLGESDADAQANCADSHGVWQNNACIYQAIPNQGVQCSAQQVGCREYKGNTSGNIFTAYSQNFENGQTADWLVGTISSEALSVGGHSIKSTYVSPNNRAVTDWADLGTTCSDQNLDKTGGLPSCKTATDVNCFDPPTAKCRASDTSQGGTGTVCQVDIGQRYCGVLNSVLTPGKTYILSFWAKSSSTNINNLGIEIMDQEPTAVDPNNIGIITIGSTNLGPDWNYYSFGPIIYTGATNPSARLRFINRDSTSSNATDFYLDNIQIQEVKDYVYVIKHSWKTPVSCDTNSSVTPSQAAPQFMLGCEQYKNSSGQTVDLKSFSSLCRQEAVGCQAMIDTQNSSSPFASDANAADPVSDVKVAADSVVYMVNQPQYQCAAAAKGCQALGLPQVSTTDQVMSYNTVYKVNDPDKYDTILCQNSEVGCNVFTTENGLAYFKDPGGRTCEYKQIPHSTQYGWFISGSQSVAPDCPISQPPVGDVHPDPARGYAGLCPGAFNSCTQIIDPISQVGKSVLFNGNFLIDYNGDGVPDGWDGSVLPQTNYLQQSVRLKRNTVYTLSFISNQKLTAPDLEVALRSCPGIVSYDHSLVAVNPVTSAAGIPSSDWTTDIRDLPDNGIRQYSARFSVPTDQSCLISLKLPSATSLNDLKNLIHEVDLRETGVYYVLDNSLDKTSCNGLIDPAKGCVLFNDRMGVNYKIGEDDVSYLTFDADVSGPKANGGVPVAQCAGNCDSDTVIKVQPDRTCEAWLYCTTQGTYLDTSGVERPYCAKLGLCDAMNADGTCANEVPPNGFYCSTDHSPCLTAGAACGGGGTCISQSQDTASDPKEIANYSGYSRPGLKFASGICVAGENAGSSCRDYHDCYSAQTTVTNPDTTACSNKTTGYFPYADMAEVGQSARIANGNFELTYGISTEPIGWSTVDDLQPTDASHYTEQLAWAEYKFKIDRDINNLIEGSGYLRLNTYYEAQSEEIDVVPNMPINLSAMINTQYMQYPDSSKTPSAQLLIEAYDASGNNAIIKDNTGANCTPDWQNKWYLCPNMQVPAGLGWQQRYFSFTVPSTATKLRIKVSNYVNDPACNGLDRYNRKANACNLGGYSLFDSISLKPVLNVNNAAPNNFVARSCRVYPTSDALACVNVKNNGVYFGEYGYCMTTDPQNPGQCLQWWPVDQIQGETLDEVTAGYNDRVPLDYCTERNVATITFGNQGTIARIGMNLPNQFQGVIADSGSALQFVPFNIPDDYAPMFRWPYVQSIHFNGNIVGVDRNFTIWIGIPFSVDMYRDHFCFNMVDLSGAISGGIAGTNLNLNQIMNGLTSLFNGGSNQTGLQPFFSSLLNGNMCFGFNSQLLGALYNTPDSQWGGWGAIPIAVNLESIIGFPLGIAIAVPIPWSMAQGTLGQLEAAFSSYFNSSGGLGGVIGFGTPIGAKIVTDQDKQFNDLKPDPVPSIDGDILGAVWFANTVSQAVYALGGRFTGDVPVNYCSEIVRVVTAAGSNKGYANRLSSGSGYVNIDPVVQNQIPSPIDECNGITGFINRLLYPDSEIGKYYYLKSFNYNAFLDNPCLYQSSDYQPFGALVAPTNSQYPTAWNSRTSIYKQPLFYEPPDKAKQPPYQARMGELHSPQGLQQLFAKSYGIWHWVWNQPGVLPDSTLDARKGGFYDLGPDPNHLYNLPETAPWDVPTTQCATNPRSTDPTAAPCYIRPTIDPANIKVDNGTDTLVTNSGTVKLSFTIAVDPDQLPVTAYTVDWGDGDQTIVNGVVLRNRTNPSNPFILYHLYNYWTLQKVSGGSIGNKPTCSNQTCTTKIIISATDNWGVTSNPATLPGVVTVTRQ